ncbi:MAG: Rap1a/Tai family immunity protein, partial [Burkholderiales bacterium]
MALDFRHAVTSLRRHDLLRALFVVTAAFWMTASLAAAADADAYTAAVLLEDFTVCDTKPDHYRCGRAASYVKGFAKRLLQGHVGDPQRPQICLRSDIGVAELMDLTRAYLEAHPERSSELAVWL